MGQKIKVKDPKTGIEDTFDIDSLDESEAKDLFQRIDSGKLSKVPYKEETKVEIKPEEKNWNKLPSMEVGPSKIDILKQALGLGSTAVGIGAHPQTWPLALPALAASVKNPPETWSDVGSNVLMPKIAGQIGKGVGNIAKNSTLGQALLQGGASGAWGLVEQMLRDQGNNALDPKAKMKSLSDYLPSLNDPGSIPSLMTSMGLGGAMGAAGVHAQKGRADVNFLDELLSKQNPTPRYQLPQEMQAQGPGGTALQVPLQNEAKYQGKLQQGIADTQRDSLVRKQDMEVLKNEKLDKTKLSEEAAFKAEEAQRENRRQIGQLELERRARNNPTLQSLYQDHEDFGKMYEAARQQDKQQGIPSERNPNTQRYLQKMDQIQQQIAAEKARIIDDKIKRQHQMLDFPETITREDQLRAKQDHDQAVLDINKQITDHQEAVKNNDTTIRDLKEKALSGKYDARVKTILDSGQTHEEITKNLLNSNPAEISHFMDIMTQKEPKTNIRESVLQYIASQSYKDGRFGNFKQIFNSDQSQFPNIQARLEAVYGDKNKAQRVTSAMESLDHAAETRQKFSNANDKAVTIGAGNILFQTMAGTAHAAANIGKTIATMGMIQTPKLIDYMANNPKSGKYIEAWLQQGAPTTNLKMGDPVRNALMEAGARFYKMKDDGSSDKEEDK